MTPPFIQCYPLGFHDIRVDGLLEGGQEKDWAASRLHSLTEEMCPLAFHLASRSLCPFPSLPLVSDDGWSCPHLSSPSWALCLPWAVVLPSRTLPNLSHTCSQIERWLCHSQRKLFGALFLASLWIQHQYCLRNVGWKESYHCLLRTKLGRWGLLSSVSPSAPHS